MCVCLCAVVVRFGSDAAYKLTFSEAENEAAAAAAAQMRGQASSGDGEMAKPAVGKWPPAEPLALAFVRLDKANASTSSKDYLLVARFSRFTYRSFCPNFNSKGNVFEIMRFNSALIAATRRRRARGNERAWLQFHRRLLSLLTQQQQQGLFLFLRRHLALFFLALSWVWLNLQSSHFATPDI